MISSRKKLYVIVLLIAELSRYCDSFATNTRRLPQTGNRIVLIGSAEAASSRYSLFSSNNEEDEYAYKNPVAGFLSNFLDKSPQEDPLADIDFNCPKIPRMPLETLAQALDAELIESEWFVSGRVNPAYFSDDFYFADPDVSSAGIETYARGVRKIFDPKTARAQIISTKVNETATKPTITCTWRLSGNVNLGLTIKPYIVYSDLTVDEATGLVTSQEDRFDLPSWDILLSALFPFLIGSVTAPPAPEVVKRNLEMPIIR